MKILLTGGNGFVGKALSKYLKSKSHDIMNPGDFALFDFCDWESVRSLPESETIIHLASKSFIPDSFIDPYSFYNNNFLSTLHVLEKARVDGSRVIFFSTYVYGNPIYLPIDENHMISPLNPYTQSKIIGEQLCGAYSRDFNVPIIIFRPFNIYGPNQSSSFFIPSILSQINNKVINLADPRPKRDFIHVDDVADAVYKSIMKESKSIFEIYNLGSGVSTSVKEIINIIIRVGHSKASISFSNQIRKGEVLETVADISKINKELCWSPKIPIENGIADLLKLL